jgi:hypothetical protein
MMSDSIGMLRAFKTWCGTPRSNKAFNRSQSLYQLSQLPADRFVAFICQSSVVMPFCIPSRRNTGMRSLSNGSLKTLNSG